jgi:hypothetical protein
MDNFFRKLSIFDLLAVLLPGIAFTGSVFMISEWGCYRQNLNMNAFFNLSGFERLAIFIIVSYFLGIMIQEIGILIEKYVPFWKGKEKAFLENNSKFLTEEEKHILIELVGKEYYNKFDFNDRRDCEKFFDYVDARLTVTGLSEVPDKIQANFGLSRGLFCSVILILLSLLFWGKGSPIEISNMIIFPIICLLSVILLLARMRRVKKRKMWYMWLLYYVSLDVKS